MNVPTAQRFYVDGHVRNPGPFILDPGMTVQVGHRTGWRVVLDRGSDRGMMARRLVKGKMTDVEVKLDDKVLAGDTIVLAAPTLLLSARSPSQRDRRARRRRTQSARHSREHSSGEARLAVVGGLRRRRSPHRRGEGAWRRSAAALPYGDALARLGEAGNSSARLGAAALAGRLAWSAGPAMQYVVELGRLVDDLRPDVIHTHGLKMHVLAAWAAGIRASRPLSAARRVACARLRRHEAGHRAVPAMECAALRCGRRQFSKRRRGRARLAPS